MNRLQITVAHESVEDLLNDAKDLASGRKEHRWLRDDDTLLREPAKWNDGVSFSKYTYSRHVHIWTGFMAAGDMLTQIALQDSMQKDNLIFPILYNYRHGVELALKWFINNYNRYIGDFNISSNIHDLRKLWSNFRKIVISFEPHYNKTLANAERIIEQFHALDKNSVSFRYPGDKRGNAIALPAGLIDIQNLKDVMEAVDNFFSDCDGWLNECTSKN